MKRRLAAIMSLDVAGFSRLMAKDEAGTYARLRLQQEEVIAPAVTAAGGRIVKLIGDGALAEFGSVVDAVGAAVAIQAGGDAQALRLRIGIHLGDVIAEGAEDTGDIYGDGVNIATRVEALSEPGGICLSALAHESLGNRAGVRFEDAGEHQVKNIDRPIRVFRWQPDPDKTAPMFEPLADKPSIAVLPFVNMSGDAEQEYFSDGVTEDIITELSRFSELFVIARNSSFVFKGQPVDLREAAAKLGVRFIVEGSVRKAGNRVRVTAQLIDAASGAHVWADRYDRDLQDIFEVQDDVVRAIVAVLPGRIAAAGHGVAKRKAGTNMTAFDCLLRGYHQLYRRGAAINEAIRFFIQAIEIDQDYGAAHAGLSLGESMLIWDFSDTYDDPLGRALTAGKRAVELDPDDYMCHTAYGTALRVAGAHEEARDHLERALALNPNSVRAMGYYAMLQAYSENPQDALETYAHAIKLDPFSQRDLKLEILSESNYNLRDYRASIAALERMLEQPIFYSHQQIAIAYAMLDDTEKVAHHMALYRQGLLDSYDEMRLFESHMRLCQLPEQEEHWREGYRRIGMDV